MGIDKIHKSMVLELDSIELEAGIGGYTAGSLVYLNNGTGILDTADTEEKARTCVGIADETKPIGEAGSVRMTGTVTFSGWTWNIGDEIWASPSVAGGLTTIASGSLLYVGVAVASNKIVITLKRTNTKATQNTITMTAGSGLAEGTWVYFDTTDSKVKPLLATANTDNIKLLGVVITPGVINNGDDVEILNFGIWNSSSPIAGAIGDRWLSITVAGELQATAPISTKAIWVGSKVSTSTMFVSLGRQGDNGSNYPLLSANQIQSYTGGQQVQMLEGIKTDTINELTPAAGVIISPKTITPEMVVEEIKNAAGSTFFGKRQTVVAGRRGKVHADFLEADTGLAVTAIASPSDPIITSIANGFDDFGREINFLDRIESDINFTGLAANATNFLGLKKETNGTLTQLKTLLPPAYGQIFQSDRENKINATFNGTSGDIRFIDQYSNVFNSYGAGWAITSATQFNSMNTWRCAGGSGTNRIEHIPKFTTRSLEQFTYETYFKTDNAIPVSGTYQNILVVAGAAADTSFRFWLHPGAGRPYFYLSQNESSWNIWANEPSVVMTGGTGYDTVVGHVKRTGSPLGAIKNSDGSVQSNEWYHFAWVFDGLHHNMYLNGFLIRTTRDENFYSNNEVITYLKGPDPVAVYLGADRGSNSEKLMGHISNFAFHPYAKYQSKICCYGNTTAEARDTFIPEVPPFISETNSNRYFQESEAIYLNFENASDGDITTKDKYGRTLFCNGNTGNVSTTATGSYIQSGLGTAKSGNGCLYISPVTPDSRTGAYIKAPVWADTWTTEFWIKPGDDSTSSHCILNLVVPEILGTNGFRIFYIGNTLANVNFWFRAGSDDSSSNILNYNTTSFGYDMGTYYHIAVSYDGTKYRVFIDGTMVFSYETPLRVINGSYFVLGRRADNNEYLGGHIDEFVYVPYCKYGSDYDITPFTPAASFTSSMPDQYAFDIKKMQMYKGSDGAYTAENTLFIAEATTSNTEVVDITTYALNGEYQEKFSLDGYSPSVYGIARKHNIGIPSRFLDIEDYGIFNGGYYTQHIKAGSKIKLFMVYSPTAAPYPLSDILDRKYYFMAKSNNGYVGAGRIPTSSYWDMQGSQAHWADFLIQVKRNF